MLHNSDYGQRLEKENTKGKYIMTNFTPHDTVKLLFSLCANCVHTFVSDSRSTNHVHSQQEVLNWKDARSFWSAQNMRLMNIWVFVFVLKSFHLSAFFFKKQPFGVRSRVYVRLPLRKIAFHQHAALMRQHFFRAALGCPHPRGCTPFLLPIKQMCFGNPRKGRW